MLLDLCPLGKNQETFNFLQQKPKTQTKIKNHSLKKNARMRAGEAE